VEDIAVTVLAPDVATEVVGIVGVVVMGETTDVVVGCTT
jgi:hypothetical protein